MVKKKGQQGGIHPADCNCKGPGCLSNPDYLKKRLAELKAAGKGVPPTWPKKYRDLLVVDGAGQPTWEVKDGATPTMAEQVEGVLKRKPLPMPSEVTKQTVITEQVPLRVNIPFRIIAKGINTAQRSAEPPAPAEAMMDDTQEQENILNEYFQKAFPDVMVSPKLAFVTALAFWFIPPAFYWIPRWLKGKFKNWKFPWSKKKDEKPAEPAPEGKP